MRINTLMAPVRSIPVVLAIAFCAAGPASAAEIVAGARMFPLLAAGPSAATSVTIEGPRYSLELELLDGVWIATDHGGYPVKSAPIEAVVAAMAGFVAVEIATEDPADYAGMGVAAREPDVSSEAIEVIIRDGYGEVLAEGIVGSPTAIMTPRPRSGILVRRTEDAAVWLSEGGMSIPQRLSAWFEPLLQVRGPDVAAIAFYRGTTLLLEAQKTDFETGTYSVTAVAEEIGPLERVVADWDSMRAVAQAVVSVTADDVRGRDAVAIAEDARTIVFTTRDGLMLSLTLADVDGAVWVLIDAAAEEGAPAAATAQAIRDRTSEWAFLLPEFNTISLTQDLSNLYILLSPAGGGSFF